MTLSNRLDERTEAARAKREERREQRERETTRQRERYAARNFKATARACA